MKARLLEPFGMTTRGYIWNETFATRAARPHDVKGRQRTTEAHATDVARYAAAGDLEATPTEYEGLLEVIRPGRPTRPPDHGEPEGDVSPACEGTERVGRLRPWMADRSHGKGEIIQHGGDNPGFHTLCRPSNGLSAPLS